MAVSEKWIRAARVSSKVGAVEVEVEVQDWSIEARAHAMQSELR